MKLGRTKAGGFTLVELLVCGSVAVAVGGIALSVLNTTMLLSAKNLSVNGTNNSARISLDRLERAIQQADSMPILINSAGAPAISPAAGIRLDQFIGGPYVLTVPSSGVPATATVLTLNRSTDPLASPPLPEAGDVIMIDSFPANVRPRVTSVSVGSSGGGRQSATVQLAAPLGRIIPGASTGSVLTTAHLVRNVAFIVASTATRRELRMYGSMETTTNFADPAGYVVITDQVAMQPEDSTPFSTVQFGGKSFINTALRVRSAAYDKRLARFQQDEFSTFMRLDWLGRPKASL